MDGQNNVFSQNSRAQSQRHDSLHVTVAVDMNAIEIDKTHIFACSKVQKNEIFISNYLCIYKIKLKKKNE